MKQLLTALQLDEISKFYSCPSSSDFTIGKMIEKIETAPIPFIVDLETVHQAYLTRIDLRDEQAHFKPLVFRGRERIDSLFEAFKFVLNYEDDRMPFELDGDFI